LSTWENALDAVRFVIENKIQLDPSSPRILIDQVIGADRGASNFLWEYVKSKQGKPDRVNDTALALPVLTEDIILAWKKIQAGV
jgi:hypothetical protein